MAVTSAICAALHRGTQQVSSGALTRHRFLHGGAPFRFVRTPLTFQRSTATSHEALDRDDNFQEEVRNAARTLMEAADGKRKGLLVEGGTRLKEPRPK
jgi:hypothetical protein